MITTALAIALCPAPPAVRVTCVVDGDTVWIDREKIRIAGIDAPETRARCRREKQLASAATHRLVALLNEGPIHIRRTGRDRFDRTLANLTVNGRDVGKLMVSGGYARQWTGRRETWC
ncbi:hypothetical protein HME9302_00028 [Alteripontixanthobacter maritimus]|uniref:TNase-like domain-containing protein n=1 Tax=Alteripontixanthobacter maritimus TaxID=2161824 RepID=A0A369Q972_9SPHN|nr:thermonuclease family protein [Alteripontixanthobacter maritimus]RDC59807.1 hypothetical protein HME9302_01002 [Alteripontixanthobacter maritimus]RDC66577.1 hypothetical protein HME9302_00028 [Alteripontixanthobacter maritimus]